MNRRHEVNPHELKRLYVDERLTIDEVASYLGCSATTVRRRLNEFSISTRPHGPYVDPSLDYEWSSKLAYAVGLIATDGNLSKDGRHLTVTSVDRDLLETLCDCLDIKRSIKAQKGLRQSYYRVQWSDRQFYNWLIDIGLMPAKSLQLGALKIPDEYFADFARGCLDGDGNIHVYTDRYNTFKDEKYVYERLFVRLTSASLAFIEWFQANITRFVGVSGGIYQRKPRAGRAPAWDLQYAKNDSIRLLKWLYYAPDIPCLARKFNKAQPFLL